MAGWFDKLLGDLLGGPRKVDKAVPSTSIPMFADWLPYRSFDPKTALYYNSASRGFILEVSRLVGADDQTSAIIAHFRSEGIPDKTSTHTLQWLSPRTASRLLEWSLTTQKIGRG